VLIKEEEAKTLSQWAQELETRSRRPQVLPWRDQARPAASDSLASDQSVDGNVLSSIVIDSLDANVRWDSVCPSENCRHPEDHVPPHTSSKSRQGAERASTRCHTSCSFGPHLPTDVGSGATTCHATPDLTSLLR
jgi:hypothetical protein